MLVEMLGMLERGTNLFNLIEASQLNLNQIHFKNEYLGKPSGLA
jgi:hypothetical protein